MSHKKLDREIWPHRFNLSSDNADDVRLHEHLKTLAEKGDASQWVRDTLLAAVTLGYNSGTRVVPKSFNQPATPKSTPMRTNGKQEPHYEDVKE